MSRNKGKGVSQPKPLEGARVTPPIQTDALPPIWCFKHLQKNWGVDELNKDQRSTVLKALVLRSAVDWRTLRTAPSQGLGRERLSQKQIKSTIPAIVGNDAIEIFHCGDGRIAGVKREQQFLIVWIDFKFRLYDH